VHDASPEEKIAQNSVSVMRSSVSRLRGRIRNWEFGEGRQYVGAGRGMINRIQLWVTNFIILSPSGSLP